MKITEIQKNQVIYCNTQEKANLLFDKLHKLGYKWSNHTSYKDHRPWYYSEETCYNITQGTTADIMGKY